MKLTQRLIVLGTVLVGFLSGVAPSEMQAAPPLPGDTPCQAITLPVGTISSPFSLFSTQGMTTHGMALFPTCGNLVNNDVWFTVTVPASGTFVVEMDTAQIQEAGMAMYLNGFCGGFLIVNKCSDGSRQETGMPLLFVGGVAPGTSFYFRVWEQGGDNNGTFNIRAYDPMATPASPCTGIPDDIGSACNFGALPAPPPCDSTINPGLGATKSFSLTNIGATPGSPYLFQAGCQPAGQMATLAADVWYKFIATGHRVDLNLNGGLAEYHAGLYRSDAGMMVPHGCAVSTSGPLSASFELLAEGVTYYLQISGANPADAGNFDLQLTCRNDCDECLKSSFITLNPPPVNNSYFSGTTVDVTLTVNDWVSQSSNWLHGVVPTFGNGWDLSTMVFTPPPNCDGNGNWAWYTSVTSSATSQSFGPGAFYDSGSGGPFDGNPGNNYGDQCNGPWVFTWTIMTKTNCLPGEDISVTIETTGDGESGGWSTPGCLNDATPEAHPLLNCILPIEFTSLHGTALEIGDLLTWSVANSEAALQFEVERSRNGHDFEAVGWVNEANANSGYEFLHSRFEAGKSWYRLRILEPDGELSYSDIVLLSRDANGMPEVSMYPNPVKDALHLRSGQEMKGDVNWEIYSISGRAVLTGKQAGIQSSLALDIDVRDLPHGLYTIKLAAPNGSFHYQGKFSR